jgi:ABC-type sugar transport system ATPase subunit
VSFEFQVSSFKRDAPDEKRETGNQRLMGRMLEVTQLSKVFFEHNDPRKPGLVALHNVSFYVRKNEFVCLLGPSGCGKTTLIRIVAGLIRADRGEIRVNGAPVTAPGRDRCMVFQQFGLLPWRTVLSNVEFGLEIEGVSRAERQKIARESLHSSASTASSIIIRTRSPAACSSASASRARCRRSPTSCSWTSRSARSTRRRASSSRRSC